MLRIELITVFILASLFSCVFAVLIKDSEKKFGFCLTLAGAFLFIGIFWNLNYGFRFHAIHSNYLSLKHGMGAVLFGVAFGTFCYSMVYKMIGGKTVSLTGGEQIKAKRLPIFLLLSAACPILLACCLYSSLLNVDPESGIGGLLIIFGIVLCFYVVGFIMLIAAFIRRERWRACAYVLLALYLLFPIVSFTLFQHGMSTHPRPS